MKQSVFEEKLPTFPRPEMSEHTLAALCGAYVRYIATRRGISEETVMDRYYTETGKDAERDKAGFRKWAGQKVYIMDQLRVDPFSEKAVCR